MNKIKKEEVIKHLLNEEKNNDKIVVLFNTTKEKNQFTESIDNEIKAKLIIDKGKAYKATNNEIVVRDKKVVLGLHTHAKYLSSSYKATEVFEYDKN